MKWRRRSVEGIASSKVTLEVSLKFSRLFFPSISPQHGLLMCELLVTTHISIRVSRNDLLFGLGGLLNWRPPMFEQFWPPHPLIHFPSTLGLPPFKGRPNPQDIEHVERGYQHVQEDIWKLLLKIFYSLSQSISKEGRWNFSEHSIVMIFWLKLLS